MTHLFPPTRAVRLTDVTVVCGRTGAADTIAKREMNSITSPIVMYPSGSVPSYR